MRVAAIALSLALAACATAPASKPSPPSPLHDEIARLDKQMFDAYNAHDVDAMRDLFAEDLEFFHDKGGLVQRSQMMEGLAGLFARNDGIRRDLVPGSLEVYPIPGYGAMQIGVHRFCHFEDGKEDCGVFKFAHVWRNRDGKWQVTRALSYDH